jgi:hypothetical protein
MSRRYLEDFAVGQTFGSGRLRVDKEQIKAFAAEFDPQTLPCPSRHHLRQVPLRCDSTIRGFSWYLRIGLQFT